MKTAILIGFFTITLVGFGQGIKKYECSISYTPSLLYKETDPVKTIKAENNTDYHFNQIQVGVNRIFGSGRNLSFLGGVSFCYQRLYFKDAFAGLYIYSNNAPYSPYYYYVTLKDKADISYNEIMFNITGQVNYTLPTILQHRSSIRVYLNFNLFSLESRRVTTNDYDSEGAVHNYFYDEGFVLGNKWSLPHTGNFYAGTHLHWALFKEPTPRSSFLILGLNYEFYNSPQLFDYRIFATLGLAVQFGKKKEKE